MSAARAVAPPLTAAVLDVGSNSLLLLVLVVDTDRRARVRDQALVTTRLGAGLARGGALAPAARARTLDAAAALAARGRGAGAERTWAFATAAARDASDGEAFARALAAAIEAPVEVLTGAREAELAYAAVARGLGRRGPLLVADVGGRTTELGLGAGIGLRGSASLPLGALALTEAHLRGDPPGTAALATLGAAVDGVLAATPLVAHAAGVPLAVSGGTATALAALDLGLETYEPRRVHGHVLTPARVAALAVELAALSAADRAARLRFEPERASVLPAGALVLARLAAAVGAPSLVVSEHGVRHAYLAACLAAVGAEPDLSGLWR